MMNHYVFAFPLPTLSVYRYALKADNTLIIKKLTLDDEGMFQCLASNEVGEKSAYTWMRVKSKSSINLSLSLSLSSFCSSHSDKNDLASNPSIKN